MALEEEEEQQQQEQDVAGDYDAPAPAHHPSAPPDELFDISTTVDPSYIISLIRKLLPTDARNVDNPHGPNVGDALTDHPLGGTNADHREESVSESMDIADGNDSSIYRGEVEDLNHRNVQPGVSPAEEAWEEYGCILWDLAASRNHAELMVENLILEVLLANLMVSQSVRITEICLGIIGNLACHEVPMKHIVSTNGLIGIIMEQLFLDDTQCLSETFRILTSGLQGTTGMKWAESLVSEHILHRILWITENSLNPQLIEKSVGLLLAILEGRQDVKLVLLPSLMNLGLASLLISLLSFEMGKLMRERIPERYCVLDVILHALEALSVLDDHSRELCLNKELLQLVCELVKFPDKVEVATSCVTAGVLIANILSDMDDLASEVLQDLPFLQGLLDVLPFASDDLEARKALWSIIARLLVQVQENEISLSSLHEYVLVLASKSDLIEDDLLNCPLDESTEHENLNTSGTKSSARPTALQRIICILNQWNASKDHLEEKNVMGECHASDVSKLLECCHKYTE